MDHLGNVYDISERIKGLQEEIEKLPKKNSRKGKVVDYAIIHRTEDLNEQINALILERTRELKKVRWGAKREPKVSSTKTEVIEDVPSAFHGTHPGAVSSIMKFGLSPGAAKRDRMMEEANQQKGPAMNRPRLYLATHCDGGSEAYATTFTVKNNDKTEEFRIVFHCRVRPDSFTIHTACVSVGHGWRVVDRTVIRPYGLLLRKKGIRS